MSIDAMRYAWHTNLSGSKKLMLLAIADRCDEEGMCFPGVTKLAKKCGIKKRAAQKLITGLEEIGELVVIVHDGTKTVSGHTNRYYMKKYRDSINVKTPSVKTRGVQTCTPQGNEGVSKDSSHEMSKSAPDEMSNDSPNSKGNPSGYTKDSFAPEKSDASKPSSKQEDTQTPENEPKARKRDILFDGIVAKGFNIDPAECSKEQLAAIAGRVGKIKSRLIKINPAFKEMSDEEIRSEIKSFWNWYKQLYDFSEAHLKSDVKWGEYYLQYHQSDKQDTTDPHNNVIAKRTMQKYHAEQERLQKLKGENQ